MYPPHIKEALEFILFHVCEKIHKARIEQICEDIKMLNNFKSLSRCSSESSQDMFKVVDQISEYRLFKLILLDV